MPLPWSAFWERNYFLDFAPTLQAVALDDRVRGGISGLGLVNMLAAALELTALIRRSRT